MNMKYLGIDYGWLIEGFVILPSFSWNWMTLRDGRYYDLTFQWLFWYFTIGEIKNKLKENGYY